MAKIKVEAVYLLDSGGMDKEHLSAVVSSPSLHKGEVEQAVAEKHNVDYKKVQVVKWRQI